MIVSDEGQPVRTCIGCRSRCPAGHLLRVVAVDGAAVPDPIRRLPGRGAHLHPTDACLDQALRRRALGRALRTPVDDVSRLTSFVTQQRAVAPQEPAADATRKEGLDSTRNTDVT